MTTAEWQTLVREWLDRHWGDYFFYEETSQWTVARFIKKGCRGVRDTLLDMPLYDNDAAVFRAALARLKIARDRHVAFYKDDDWDGWGAAVFTDVARKLQARLDAVESAP